MEFEFDIDRCKSAFGGLNDWLASFPKESARAIESALKSEGYRLTQRMRGFVRSNGEGTWKELNPHTGILSKAHLGIVKNYRMVWKGEKGKKKRVREYYEVMHSTRRSPMAKFAGALRYRYDKNTQAVSIGFIQSQSVSGSFIRLAKKHSEGFKTSITPKMRKFLFALGFPVKKTTTEFESPPRPIIEPVARSEENNIPKNIEAKFFQNLARYFSQGN